MRIEEPFVKAVRSVSCQLTVFPYLPLSQKAFLILEVKWIASIVERTD